MKYFVSYTIRDKEITKELLEKFAKVLRNLGDVFIDIIDNNSKDKQARVIAELDSCDMLVLIESGKVYKSPWVFLELEIAKYRKMPIVKIPWVDLENISETDCIKRLNIK